MRSPAIQLPLLGEVRAGRRATFLPGMMLLPEAGKAVAEVGLGLGVSTRTEAAREAGAGRGRPTPAGDSRQRTIRCSSGIRHALLEGAVCQETQ